MNGQNFRLEHVFPVWSPRALAQGPPIPRRPSVEATCFRELSVLVKWRTPGRYVFAFHQGNSQFGVTAGVIDTCSGQPHTQLPFLHKGSFQLEFSSSEVLPLGRPSHGTLAFVTEASQIRSGWHIASPFAPEGYPVYVFGCHQVRLGPQWTHAL